VASTLRNNVCARSGALDIDSLADKQARIGRLRHHDENAAIESHDDLLGGLRLVIMVLGVLAADCAGDCANRDRDVPPRPGADQASECCAACAAKDGADAELVGMFDLGRRDLLNAPLAYFRCGFL
jgi:hypothetical protein